MKKVEKFDPLCVERNQQNIYSDREKLSGRSEQLFKIPTGLNPDSNPGKKKYQNMQTSETMVSRKQKNNLKNNKIGYRSISYPDQH
jgi:hypothetical protein